MITAITMTTKEQYCFTKCTNHYTIILEKFKLYNKLADIFFELTDDLYDKGKINIKPLDYALMINSTTIEQEDGLLSDEEKGLLDKICNFWKDKRTNEIVNFTHEQKPWKMCRDGEYIPYSLIIQEDPNHVYAPNI